MDGVENIVTNGVINKEAEIDTESMNSSGYGLEENTEEILDDSFEMPEDLSAKHRTASVQTETCLLDKFEQIFKGFSPNQIRSLLNVLVTFISKEDDRNLDKLETFSGKLEKVTFHSLLISIFIS